MKQLVWVIGASTGIGRELALQLARDGYFVIASARRVDTLNELVDLEPNGIAALPFDVNDSSSLSVVKAAFEQRNTPLAKIVYCAGICLYEDDLSFEPSAYESVIGTNFLGLVRSLHVAMPWLLEFGQSDKALSGEHARAQIVAVGSLSSLMAFTRAQSYGSSKAAMDYFIEALRLDVSQLPIDVTLVRPGFVSTTLVANNDFPMPFIMTPKQASERILRGTYARKPVINFPRRLTWLIKLMAATKFMWLPFLAKKMTRIKISKRIQANKISNL